MSNMRKEQIDMVIESINTQRNIVVSEKIIDMLIEHRGFFVLLIIWKKNKFLNYLHYKSLKDMYNWNKEKYILKLMEKTIPLNILKEMTKIYPEEEMKKLINDNVSLTYKALGFNDRVFKDFIYCYVNNYHDFKKNIKFNKSKKAKQTKNEKREKLISLIDNLYKESIE